MEADPSRRSSAGIVEDMAVNEQQETHENVEAGEEGTVQPSAVSDAAAAEQATSEMNDSELQDSGDRQPEEVDRHEQQYIEQMERRKATLKQQLQDKKKVLPSYYTNSRKEQLILQYVDNFNRQYCQLYPGRKELFLSPPNEFSLKKFVCTTIRATQLPYKELYDYRGCASFVADFVTYEPLDPPHELPKSLVSPTYTLKIQSGNCFDMSVLLTSLLRGVGYDAYVVSGYATRNITLMDQTHTSTNQLDIRIPGESSVAPSTSHLDKPAINDTAASSKYKVKPPRQLKSNFLTKQEERLAQLALKRDQEQERIQIEKSKVGIICMIPIEEEEDELKGLRIHAWVLVLPGKREIAEAFFIEPSTGKIYSTENENYLGLESVFSSQNYWVNMQPGGISNKNADMSKDNENASDDDEDDENTSEISFFFESRCPSGTKIVTYKNAKMEIFADYHRADGMVSRVTYLSPEGQTTQIHEFFDNRRDKLYQRIRVPDSACVREFFSPGRVPHGLKEHILINNETTEMHFYPSARSDGLLKRLESPRKVIETFIEREDCLSYRSVTYEIEDDARGGLIKMTEKFSRNSALPAHQDIHKKTYFLKDEKIRIVYHLEEGRIIASISEFRKPASDQKGHIVELTNYFEVDPYIKQPKKQHLYAQLLDLLRTEQACMQAIKNSERELGEILQLRQAEERDVSLTISVYDTLRNDTKLPADDDGKDAHKVDEEEAKTVDLDYLSPFLINYTTEQEDPNNLSREDALTVKDACLKSLKERLIEKANIIQGRLDEVTAEYQKRQLVYSRNADSMTVEETDDYVRFCNDALFRIHILEKRLAKACCLTTGLYSHTHKETAPERYIELDSKLRMDSRLAAAFQ
eukprot:jgi/Hompol1/4637/HPOL_001817-RA